MDFPQLLPRLISFLRTLDTDAWLLHPTNDYNEFLDQIEDLWLQGSFMDFTGDEVIYYSDLTWLIMQYNSQRFVLPSQPTPLPWAP